LPTISWTISSALVCRPPAGADALAVAQHGDAVGDAEDLLQPVADVHDGDAAALTLSMIANRRSLSVADRAAVGSSSTRMRPSRARARAISISCFSPMLRRRPRAGVESSSTSASRARARRMQGAVADQRGSRPRNRFSATDRLGTSASSW
jgi:hypothetical protein